jgi:hypothetical protein
MSVKRAEKFAKIKIRRRRNRPISCAVVGTANAGHTPCLPALTRQHQALYIEGLYLAILHVGLACYGFIKSEQLVQSMKPLWPWNIAFPVFFAETRLYSLFFPKCNTCHQRSLKK